MLDRIKRWGEISVAAILLVIAGSLALIPYWILSVVQADGVVQPQERAYFAVAVLYEMVAVFVCVPMAVCFMTPGHESDDE